MSVALQLGPGVSYIPTAPQTPGEVHSLAVLAGHGLPAQPQGISADDWFAQLNRASRIVDALEFRTDGDDYTQLQRYAIGDEVPDRVSAAVALMAYYLPSEGGVIPEPARNPERIRAGEVEIDFASSDADLDPAKSDDMILADRLGIPSIDAFRLLKPFLVLPDRLSQGSSRRGVSFGGAFAGGAVVNTLQENVGSLLEA